MANDYCRQHWNDIAACVSQIRPTFDPALHWWLTRILCGTLALRLRISRHARFTSFRHWGRVMAKYSKASGKKVQKAMEEMKAGTLRSGRSKKKVTNPKQAIAIGLSEARAEGKKVPRKRGGARRKAAR
jgi:hypothetical protein